MPIMKILLGIATAGTTTIGGAYLVKKFVVDQKSTDSEGALSTAAMKGPQESKN